VFGLHAGCKQLDQRQQNVKFDAIYFPAAVLTCLLLLLLPLLVVAQTKWRGT
jgi:hypothetical protein